MKKSFLGIYTVPKAQFLGLKFSKIFGYFWNWYQIGMVDRLKLTGKETVNRSTG
jgi:hypothetical protein